MLAQLGYSSTTQFISRLVFIILTASATYAGHTGNVPPAEEIVVLDPNAHPRGQPAIELHQDPNGQLKVNIPPVVLVHKYYYTGDRSFQAQLLPGGPSLVVVNHPKTGERCYLEVQMPPGAPRVTYTSHKIEYDFELQGLTISFWPAAKPKVVYRNGVRLSRRLLHVTKAAGTGVSQLVDRTGITEHASDAARGAKAAIHKTADCAHEASNMALLPFKQICNMTPIGSLFTPSPEDEAKRKRDRAVNRAGEKLIQAEATIPTLR